LGCESEEEGEEAGWKKAGRGEGTRGREKKKRDESVEVKKGSDASEKKSKRSREGELTALSKFE